MWKTNIIGKEQIWYSEEEYKEIADQLARCNEMLYNIEEHLKERHDWIAIQKIGEEVEKWKKSSNVKNVE